MNTFTHLHAIDVFPVTFRSRPRVQTAVHVFSVFPVTLLSTLVVPLVMHALPATAHHTPDAGVSRPAVDAPRSPVVEPVDVPWLYRSEGFAEDLETDAANEPPQDPPFLRWGLPVIAMVGVVGLAAAFSLV